MPPRVAPQSHDWLEESSGRTSLPRLLRRLRPLGARGDSGLSSGRGHPAQQLLFLLVSSAYRKGSLHSMRFAECQQALLRTIRRSIDVGRPVPLTLMAFPFKVPNPAKVGARVLPDLAELAAILRLCELNAEAKTFYEPGLEIHIIHDGSYIADIFGIPLPEVRQYERYFAGLLRAAGAGDFIFTHDFLDLFGRSAGEIERQLEDFKAATLRWWYGHRSSPEWTHLFAKTLGMMNLREIPSCVVRRLMAEARAGSLDCEYRPLERRVHQAMLNYHLRDSLLHGFDPRPNDFPDAIQATTQERPKRLALWLVRRGNSLLPWHSVGVIDRRGRLGVDLAHHVDDHPSYRPVFLEHEQTPFFYLETQAT